VTSRASVLPFLERNVDEQSAELLPGKKCGCEDSSLLGCDVLSIGDYLPLFGWRLLPLSFSWPSHFTGKRTNPVSVGSQFLNSADFCRRYTVGFCVVYYLTKLTFFLVFRTPFLLYLPASSSSSFFISFPFPTYWSIQLNVQVLMANSEIEAVHIYCYVISVFKKALISFFYHVLFRLHNTTFLPSD
jgi:hypothetical protein